MVTPHPTQLYIASESIAPYAIDTGARAVKLFRNGANQAVRIPKEFELPGTQALMHREGNRLILELVPDRPKKGTAAALLAALFVVLASGKAAKPDTTEPRPSQPGKQDNQSKSNQKALHIHRICVRRWDAKRRRSRSLQRLDA